MRIALVNPEHPTPSGRDHGGIATYTYAMADALAAAGHIVTILARVGTLPDTLHPAVRFRTFDFVRPPSLFPAVERRIAGNSWWERGCAAGLARTCRQIVEEEGLDCVEVPEYCGLSSGFGKAPPFTVIVCFHTPSILVDELNLVPPGPARRSIYRMESRAVAQADGWRAPSCAMRDDAARRYGILPQNIVHICNPMPPVGATIVRKEFAADNRIELLFCGRLETRKGAGVLADNAAAILSLDERIHITIAGETRSGEARDWRGAIERTLDETTRRRIWFIGPQKRENLPLLYRRSDIFLMPSPFENAPYALMEAMMAGIPVIAARSPGIIELVEHEQSGLLFSGGEELLRSLQHCIDSPELRSTMIHGARQHLHEHHDPLRLAENSLRFYSSLRSSRP